MQHLDLLKITVRRLAGITLLSLLFCAAAQARMPGRGYGGKPPTKPTPAPTQQYQVQSSCPPAGCVGVFQKL
ncbi:hypothetical protein [Methylomonas sp. TEB]|uniref:hypothetical protein n=1 Tax=Methylomonas sp. TEB TaxID=3398229 RepID=UPI0039F61A0C